MYLLEPHYFGEVQSSSETPTMVHINSTGMGGVVHRHNSNANTVYILRIKVVHKKIIYTLEIDIYIFFIYLL